MFDLFTFTFTMTGDCLTIIKRIGKDWQFLLCLNEHRLRREIIMLRKDNSADGSIIFLGLTR